MDEARRRAMRTQHTRYSHTCRCGRKVWGNGGWASHRWACPQYQASIEEYVEKYGHVPYGDVNVRRAPKWTHDGKRWVRVDT